MTILLFKKVLVSPSLICLLLVLTIIKPATAQDADSIMSSKDKVKKMYMRMQLEV